MLRHPELEVLALAHVDCDAFYASVEKRDDPSLADRPLIVGGGARGVVTTACYIARRSGVRSAMPMFKALALCPQATVIRPDMAKYGVVSRQVREVFLDATPVVEPVSLDEAYLDLSGTERLHGEPPAIVLARLARRIESEIGITVSIGLSHNKLLAKLASELDKPRGFGVVGRAGNSPARAFLDQPFQARAQPCQIRGSLRRQVPLLSDVVAEMVEFDRPRLAPGLGQRALIPEDELPRSLTVGEFAVVRVIDEIVPGGTGRCPAHCGAKEAEAVLGGSVRQR